MSRDLDEVLRQDPSVTPPSPSSPHAHRPIALCVAGVLVFGLALALNAVADGSRWIGLPLMTAGALMAVGGVLLARDYAGSTLWMARDFFRAGQSYRISWGEPTIDRTVVIRIFGGGWAALGIVFVAAGAIQLVAESLA